MNNEKIYKYLAFEFKALRIKQNLSLNELAQIACLSVNTIRKVETGNYKFHLFTFYKLCKAFKINHCEIIKRAEKQMKKRHP